MNDNAAVPHKLTKVIELIRELTVSSLQELQTVVAKEIHMRGAEDRRVAILQIQAIAQSAGIDLRHLANTKAPQGRKSTGPIPPMYANPANPAETWTGRGRKPRWIASQLDAGADISQFKIAA